MHNYDEFPNFCGKPFKPVDPFVPPAPSVLEGSSLYEAMNNLVNRVNKCIGTYNAAIADCYSTLNKLYRAGQANGSYYTDDEVCTEYKYDTTSQCDYAVISKKCVDNQGQPIRTTLHLAQGLHKNEGIQENIWEKSYAKISDKITLAQNPDQNGWFGVVFKNGIMLASREVENTFTVGFSKNGDMHVYSNSIPKEQYLHDEIVDSCGVMGYTIANKQNIAIDDDKQVRIQMGYNNLTKMLFFIVCATPGMTQKEMSNIMMSYGVSNAVELTNNENGVMLNAGAPIYYTDISKIEGNLFWSISRKKSYKNDQQYEIGRLFQIYSKQMNSLETAQKKIDSLKSKLEQEIADRIAGDTALQNNIDVETQNRIQADNTLQTNINNEESARITADNNLQTQINNHETEIDTINGRLDVVENDISTINNRVNAIISGETRLPYLKALTTNGNITAYDINFDNTYNILNLGETIAPINSRTGAAFGDIKYTNRNFITTIERPVNTNGYLSMDSYGGMLVYRHWSGDTDTGRATLTIPNAQLLRNNLIKLGKITVDQLVLNATTSQGLISPYKNETNPITIEFNITWTLNSDKSVKNGVVNFYTTGFITGENEGALIIANFSLA